MSVDMLNESAALATQGETATFEQKVLLPLNVENPWPVRDGDGVVIGAATATFSDRGLLLHVVLDKHTPEAFDLEVNFDHSQVQVEFACNAETNYALVGSVVLGALS